MAGPLNLDNYSIEADESADKLVITHTPTSKTTAVSEGAFNTEGLRNSAPDGDQFWPSDHLRDDAGNTWDVSGVSDSEAGTLLQQAWDQVSPSGYLYVPPRNYVQNFVWGPGGSRRSLVSFGRQNARIIGNGSHAFEIDMNDG